MRLPSYYVACQKEVGATAYALPHSEACEVFLLHTSLTTYRTSHSQPGRTDGLCNRRPLNMAVCSGP